MIQDLGYSVPLNTKWLKATLAFRGVISARVILILFMLMGLLIFLLIPAKLNSQVFSNKEVGKKNAAKIDSIKNSEWPYVLPIWGKKATKKGFNLPYPAGLNINYLWQESDLIIDNLMVGFNNGPMHDLDQIVRFNKATSRASALNFRPDIWLLPFLNIYGIFAKSSPSTEVNFGVWVPDSTNVWKEVMSATSNAQFDAFSMGFGITPTIGIAGGWLALDMNFTWSDIDALEKPAFAFIFGPRVGKTFNFKKPDRNLAVWVGGFRLKLNSETTGSLPLSEVIPVDELGTKVDNGIVKVNEAANQVNTWWNNLTPQEQAKPVNKAKYASANRALESAGNFLSAADEAINEAINNIGESTVQYSLDKRQKDMWNFTIGSQFQLNKHLMLRLECGFVTARTQVIAGIQYRFGF